MSRKHCVSCGDKLYPPKNISNQRYCSKKACQRSRNNKWAQLKRRNDKDYRIYRKEIQNKWKSKNPDYWIQRRGRLANKIAPPEEKSQRIKILIEKNVLADLVKTGEIHCTCQVILTLK
jgi:hypothetical protein